MKPSVFFLCAVSAYLFTEVQCNQNPVNSVKTESIVVGTYEVTTNSDQGYSLTMRYKIQSGSTAGSGPYDWDASSDIGGTTITISTEKGTWHDDDAGKNPTTISFTPTKCQTINPQTFVMINEDCVGTYVLRAKDTYLDNGTGSGTKYTRAK